MTKRKTHPNNYFPLECPHLSLSLQISHVSSSKLQDFLILHVVTNKHRREAIQGIWRLYLKLFQRSNPEKMPSLKMASHPGLQILYWIRTTWILQLLSIQVLIHLLTQCRTGKTCFGEYLKFYEAEGLLVQNEMLKYRHLRRTNIQKEGRLAFSV